MKFQFPWKKSSVDPSVEVRPAIGQRAQQPSRDDATAALITIADLILAVLVPESGDIERAKRITDEYANSIDPVPIDVRHKLQRWKEAELQLSEDMEVKDDGDENASTLHTRGLYPLISMFDPPYDVEAGRRTRTDSGIFTTPETGPRAVLKDTVEISEQSVLLHQDGSLDTAWSQPEGVQVRSLDAALFHLRTARSLLKMGEAPKALEKVRAAIRSTEGAYRHAKLRSGKEDKS